MSKNNTYCISKRKKKKKEKIVTRMKYGKVCDSLQHNNLAFTLIELSIVLIVIGLLIAGVTSGVTLIKSARIRTLANELNGYQRAVYSFYSLRDRLPGDINRKGVMGAEAFEGTVKIPGFDDFEPNASQAPLVELYVEELIDTKPVEDSLPKSKAFSNLSYSLDGRYVTISGNITKDVVEALDRMIDDGEIESGKIIYVENCEGGVADGGNISDLPPAYDGAEFSNVICLTKETREQDGVLVCSKGNCNNNLYDRYCPLDKSVGCETSDGGQNYYCSTTKKVPTENLELIECVTSTYYEHWGIGYSAGESCKTYFDVDCYCPTNNSLKCVEGEIFNNNGKYDAIGCQYYCPVNFDEPTGIPNNTFCEAKGKIILEEDLECAGNYADTSKITASRCYCPINSKIACIKDTSDDRGCGYFTYKCAARDENKKEPGGGENSNGLCSKIFYDIGF